MERHSESGIKITEHYFHDNPLLNWNHSCPVHLEICRVSSSFKRFASGRETQFLAYILFENTQAASRPRGGIRYKLYNSVPHGVVVVAIFWRCSPFPLLEATTNRMTSAGWLVWIGRPITSWEGTTRYVCNFLKVRWVSTFVVLAGATTDGGPLLARPSAECS